MKKILLILLFCFPFSVIAQINLPKFSLAGGPIFGYYMPDVKDLNNEIKKLGFGEFSTSGFVTYGGGGIMDVPGINGLRIGGFGMGFESMQQITTGNYINDVTYSFNHGGFSVEYAKKISRKFDWTIGASFGFGTLKIKFDKFPKELENWNTGNIQNDSLFASNHNSYNYSQFQFTLNPQTGIGFQLTNFSYLKLNAGYIVAVTGKWKLNEIMEVSNIPAGIKANGLNFNLSLFIGLFSD